MSESFLIRLMISPSVGCIPAYLQSYSQRSLAFLYILYISKLNIAPDSKRVLQALKQGTTLVATKRLHVSL